MYVRVVVFLFGILLEISDLNSPTIHICRGTCYWIPPDNFALNHLSQCRRTRSDWKGASNFVPGLGGVVDYAGMPAKAGCVGASSKAKGVSRFLSDGPGCERKRFGAREEAFVEMIRTRSMSRERGYHRTGNRPMTSISLCHSMNSLECTPTTYVGYGPGGNAKLAVKSLGSRTGVGLEPVKKKVINIHR
ncbi:hypothetical protein V1477_015930 [Vespula maculifrons]|uniref:Secreted protein n=1 Tax=Vespula maculifrons TaxID=7453 RepID=A0ABD2BBJ9_VESMC